MPELFTRDGVPAAQPLIERKGKPGYLEHRPCLRCGGQGGALRWAHTGWTCWRCGGAGRDPAGPFFVKVYTQEQNAKLDAALAKRRARLQAKRDAKAAAAQAEADARREAFMAAEAEFFAEVDPWIEADAFLRDVVAKAKEKASITDKQRDACLKVARKQAAKAAERACAEWIGEVGKRIEVEAELVWQKWIDGDWPTFGFGIVLLKAGNAMLKYKGGANFGATGDRVRFRAKVDAHINDEYRDGQKITLVSRPTKIEVIQHAEPA